MLFPRGRREAEGLLASSLNAASAAARGLSSLPRFTRGPSDADADYAHEDAADFRAHYEEIGENAAQGAASTTKAAGRSNTSSVGGSGSGAGGPQLLRTPETRALVASLTALRAGLQRMEAHRKRRNAALNRDPCEGTIGVNEAHVWSNRYVLNVGHVRGLERRGTGGGEVVGM
jgi:hypothetical protein